MTPILSLLAPLALAGALQGTPSFDAAVAAYGELDYEGALAKFKATDTAADDRERATLLMWVALCDAGIGDFDAARVSMREALRLGGPAVIEVRDQGQGIAPDQLPRLFESFFTTKPNGMGLGLSISRTLVEAHEGRISAENAPEGGARFRVELPLDRNRATRREARA